MYLWGAEVFEDMYIGVDIGGTKTAVVLGNDSGQILDKIKFETVRKNETIQNILNSIKSLMDDRVKAIGVSCGGPLDGKRGIILSPPNLPGWDHVEIVKLIQNDFLVPVYLQNDADAGALAEWYFGNAKSYKNVVFITCGTGFGAGLILNGNLYTGTSNSAGEIGHVRLYEKGHIGYGKEGAVEGYCSGGGIAQYGKGTAKELAERAYNGEKEALEVYRELGENLGKSLAILVDILNPEVIVIGSIYTRAERLLKNSMLKRLREEALERNYRDVMIKTSKLKEHIGDIAALCVAMDGYKNKIERVETDEGYGSRYTEDIRA